MHIFRPAPICAQLMGFFAIPISGAESGYLVLADATIATTKRYRFPQLSAAASWARCFLAW